MIYVCEHHDAVLDVWRQNDVRGIRLAHVDFHDDLRGLLVDRRRGRAYPIRGLAHGSSPVDPGNYLAHAVLEGRLDEMRWIHDIPGGRGWDTGVVHYESDVSALPDRLAHARSGRPEMPFRFSEVLLREWAGVAAGEQLSVDWDCFASVLLDVGGTAERVETFLSRLGPHTPPDTFACFSPDYSAPGGLPAFLDLVNEFARRFNQPVEWLSPGLLEGKLQPEGRYTGLPRSLLRRAVLHLRRRGLS